MVAAKACLVSVVVATRFSAWNQCEYFCDVSDQVEWAESGVGGYLQGDFLLLL